MCKKKVMLLLLTITLLTTGCGSTSGNAGGSQGNIGTNSSENTEETADTEDLKNTEESKNTEDTNDTENTEDSGNAEIVEGYLDISQYDSVSAVHGGVFFIEKDGLRGLMNTKGKVLCEPKYNGKSWSSANEDGYSVVSHDDIYYVLDKNGKEVFVWTEPAINVQVTEDNIICVNQDWGYIEGEPCKVSYWNIDGTKIGEFEGCEGYPFNDGIAIVDNDGTIQLLSKDGTLDTADNYFRGMSEYADGYCLGFEPEMGYRLIECATGKLGGAFWGDEFAMQVTDLTTVEDCIIMEYYKNGMNICQYNGFGVMEATDGTKVKYILVDYMRKDANYKLSEAIAIHDEIKFDNFKYLYARDGKKVFYIDYTGNVVSDIFIEGTAFNNSGYVMIMKEDGLRICAMTNLKR